MGLHIAVVLRVKEHCIIWIIILNLYPIDLSLYVYSAKKLSHYNGL